MSWATTYMLRFRQTWGTGGKFMENVFFYDHTAGDGNSSDLATVFNTVMVPAINALQCDRVKNYDFVITNFGDLADFAQPAVAGIGAYAADPLPPFNAINYTLKLNTRAVRKGSKRISGVPELASAAGVIVDELYITKMNDLRTLFMNELVDAGNTWLPIVVKRVKEPVVGTVPQQYTYRLPATSSELVTGEIVVALTSLNVSHQTSREV